MSNTLPTSLYSSLLQKLVVVLRLTQTSDGTVTPQAKQAILQATNDFKNAINQAREFATNLPGGEMLVEEQDDVIEMLEKLRTKKLESLNQFSILPLVTNGPSANVRMEVDSVASTPCHD